MSDAAPVDDDLPRDAGARKFSLAASSALSQAQASTRPELRGCATPPACDQRLGALLIAARAAEILSESACIAALPCGVFDEGHVTRSASWRWHCPISPSSAVRLPPCCVPGVE